MKILFVTLLLTCTLLPALAMVNEVGTLQPYLTPHFSAWLQANGYGNFSFERRDIGGGSYGGKQSDNDTIVNEPVIFLHGNSDHAILDSGDFYHFNGFTDSITYFLSQGYKESELYVTTWGPAKPAQASNQYHSYAYLNYLRNFVEAVLKYTGAKKVDIIAHSMGVTLGRKIIKGGTGTDGSTYDLGKPLNSYVDTFLGIAGANYGLVSCQFATSMPTCGKQNGFYPGQSASTGPSDYLNQLNNDATLEGDYVFTMLSTADDLILNGDKVFGRYTSQIPNEKDSKIYTNLGHMALKTTTAQEQLQIITKHQI